jgi:hypothetical protein
MKIMMAPALTPSQAVTHVLHWVPPYASGTGTGWWALQSAGRYASSVPPAGPWLNASREAPLHELTGWTVARLGYPVALELARTTYTTLRPLRLFRREPVCYIRPAAGVPADNRATFSTLAYGDSIDAIEATAIDAARELYGPDATLRVDHVDTIHSAYAEDRGKYHARVEVRCLSYLTPDGR